MSVDVNRLFGGFSSLAGGMDGGTDPSLIDPDQCSLAGNMTFRGQFATVRPTFSSLVLTFPTDAVKTAWNGFFQGACFYSSNTPGASGLVVSISGRLYYVTIGNGNNVLDVTPQVVMITTANFIVPNVGSSVTVDVNVVGVKVGDTIFIQGNQFTVTGIVSNALTVTYVGGASATVPTGTTVFNYLDNQTGITTTAPFNPPAINSTVNVDVSSSSTLATQDIFILGDHYQIQKDGIANGIVNAKLIGLTAVPFSVPSGTAVVDVTASYSTTLTAPFTPPTLTGTVNITVSAFGPISNGDTLHIYGATYVVAGAVSSNTFTIQYTVKATVCPIGVVVNNYIDQPLATMTAASFTIPAVNSVEAIPLTNTSAIGLFQVIIQGGTYIVTAITGNVVTMEFFGVTIIAGAQVLDASQNIIKVLVTNPANIDFVDVFQAENYAIALAGQNVPMIFNGSTTAIAGVGMIPPGIIGTYAWGRIWIVLNDRKSFVASDLNGDPSGTPQNLFVDAILQMSENNLLAGGGAFKIPNNIGLITSITTFPMLDTSLGIGPVMVGCTNGIVSCQAPVDRTTWQNLTYPIDTISVLDYGPTSPWSMTAVNSDLWFRSLDGIRSFKMVRHDFMQWVNVPQSQEVSNILDNDSQELLFNASSVQFDNKLFQTVSPFRTPNGISFQGEVVINFDEVSNLRGKGPPAWEGVLTGLNVLKIVKGVINGVERAFMFVANNGIEIWEINTDGKYDTVNTDTTIAYTPIESYLETRRDGCGDAEQFKALYTAELYLEEISDTVEIVIKYRADQNPIWSTWATLNFCATDKQCTLQPPIDGVCQVFKENSTQYAVRLMLPDPPEEINPFTKGYTKIDASFSLDLRERDISASENLKLTPRFAHRKWRVNARCSRFAMPSLFALCRYLVIMHTGKKI